MQNLSAIVSQIDLNHTSRNDTYVEFSNVILNKSNWIMNGLNLITNNAALVETKISLSSGAGPQKVKFVDISNSTWGQLKVSGAFHVSILDCTIDGTTILDNSLLEVMDCSLNIANSIFQNLTKKNSGPAIVNAINSQIQLHEITCSNNYPLNGLIQIMNGSYLSIDGSVFEDNGNNILSSAVVTVKFNSSVDFSNCVFNGNVALYGGMCVL